MLNKLTDIETTKAQTNKKATQLADVDAILMKPPRKKIAYIRRIVTSRKNLRLQQRLGGATTPSLSNTKEVTISM
jgi:hypothetical protein